MSAPVAYRRGTVAVLALVASIVSMAATLKLTGQAAVPWCAVFAPVLFPLIVVAGFVAVAAVVLAVTFAGRRVFGKKASSAA